MEKVIVIFRKDKKEVIAFFPELASNLNNLVCYSYIGQHSEASKEYYRACKPCKQEDYKELLRELQGIYNDCELIIRKKL